MTPPSPASTARLAPLKAALVTAAVAALALLAGCAQTGPAASTGAGSASAARTGAANAAADAATGMAADGAERAQRGTGADAGADAALPPLAAAAAGLAQALQAGAERGPATVPVTPIAIAQSALDVAVPAATAPVVGEPPRSDLWQRLRQGYALADADNELVRKWEQWYARDPAYVQRMTERGGRYLFHVMEEIDKRRLPAELALLPFTESAFNPQALSRAAAAGMWQFMPATGKDFALRQNLFRDDRRDVLASTRAALDYLQRLYATFGDWPLALAAYNWGQGNVSRAIERNRLAGLPTDYDNLKLPTETREYVPKLQAVKNIVADPARFGLALPPYENHPFFLSVPIERDIDVAVAARLAGLSLDAFSQLNPQMNKPVVLAAGTPRLLLPYDNAQDFVRRLAAHRGPLASWTAWVAPRTLKPAEAARLTGMPEAELRRVNLIPPKMVLKAGSTLLVPRAAHSQLDVAGHIADHAVMALAHEARPPRRSGAKTPRPGAMVAARRGGAVAGRAGTAAGRTVAAGKPAHVLR